MNLDAGGAAVRVMIEDLTAPGMRSVMSNMKTLERAATKAAEASARAGTSMLRAVSGRGMVMQPFAGDSRLDLLGGPGGASITPSGASNPIELVDPAWESIVDEVGRAADAAAGSMTQAARSTGMVVGGMTRAASASGTFAANMRQANGSAIGTSSAIDALGVKLTAKIAGFGAAFATIRASFGGIADGIENALRGGKKAFADVFIESFSNAMQSAPVIGSIVRLGDLFLQRIDGTLAAEEEGRRGQARNQMAIAENERLTREAEDRRRLGEFTDEIGRDSAASRLGDREASILGRQSLGIADIDELFRIDQQQAAAESKALAERLLREASSIAPGGEVPSEVRAAIRRRAEEDLQARLAVADREWQDRKSRIDDAAERQRQAAADLIREEEERKAQAESRLADLRADQESRLADATFDAAEARLGDSIADRLRAAELDAERRTAELQRELAAREREILGDDRLGSADKTAAIEAEREIAAARLSAIDAALAEARLGEVAAERVTSSSSGTFSAIAAARTNTNTQRVAEAQLAALKQLVANTSNGQGFGP